MTEADRSHLDVLGGDNPLLEAVAPFITFNNWPSALLSEPLKKCNWRSVPPELRTPLLELSDDHYWPHRMIIDAADSIQSMLRGSLMARNPMSVAEQRRINALALTQDIRRLNLQSLRVRYGGGIISAITGMGKSDLLERALSVVAPEQVVVHGRSEACGWSSLTQVLYLVIDAPSNGTRGGVLARIVAALDTLLGTDYNDTFRKLRNLDAALLFVTKLLSNHRVGLLAIDENQRDNFGESFWCRSFVLFYLGLMNLGIPVLLLGNPLAFISLESDAQTMRRFSTAGYHQLVPASAADLWWAKDFVPGMCGFSLCEEVPAVAEVLERSFPLTSGVPGLFVPVWLEAQRIALRRGGTVARMSIEDIAAAAQSPRVRQLSAMASQVSGVIGSKFLDIPAKAAKAEADSESSGTGIGAGDQPKTFAAPNVQSSVEAIRAEFGKQQARLEKMERARMLRQELGTEDLRAHEARLESFAGTENVQEILRPLAERGTPKMR